jgi:hypothetical protein
MVQRQEVTRHGFPSVPSGVDVRDSSHQNLQRSAIIFYARDGAKYRPRKISSSDRALVRILQNSVGGNERLSRATSFCLVSALLRISSTHFSAPLLRDVTAEVIEQLKERGNLRAHCPSSISTHIVKIPVSSSPSPTPSAAFRTRATSLTALDFNSVFIRPCGAMMRASAISAPLRMYRQSGRQPPNCRLAWYGTTSSRSSSRTR